MPESGISFDDMLAAICSHRAQNGRVDNLRKGRVMKDILVIGAGKIGSVVADLLAHAQGFGGAYRVTLADSSTELLDAIDALAQPRLATLQLDVAEQGLERPLAAGEVYTLGALARLYADAGRNLDRALALAQENLLWKRDREAFATLRAVEARLAARATP